MDGNNPNGDRPASELPEDPVPATPDAAPPVRLALRGARHRRARTARLQAMARAWRLYVETATPVEKIAELMGVRPDRIRIWIREVEARAMDEMRGRVFNLKSQQHAQLEQLLHETLTQYQKSRDTRLKTRKREHGMRPDGPIDVRTIEHTDPIGDPKYLEVAVKILADQRKLWGLDAPTKIAQTTPEGEAVAAAAVSLTEKLSAMAKTFAPPPPEDDPLLTDPGRVN